jgi:hypothetical protein
MKNFKKLIAFVAILASATAGARDATMLSFTEVEERVNAGGETYFVAIATVQQDGVNLIPRSAWSTYDEFLIKVPIQYVRAQDGSLLSIPPRFGLGFEGWEGANGWVPRGNSMYMGDVYAQLLHIMHCDVPGPYGNAHREFYTGGKESRVNFIENDPYLTVGNETKRLSRWAHPIHVPHGTQIILHVNPFFTWGTSGNGGANWLLKDGQVINPT